ncbi:MAG: hypothetical protein ACRDWI_14475 [Jiangellaceae bacterium]
MSPPASRPDPQPGGRLVPQSEIAGTMKNFHGSPAVGKPEQVVAALGELREMGLAYAVCYFPEMAYDRSGVELFQHEVIPALR